MIFKIITHFSMIFCQTNRIAPYGTPRSVLPMSHKNDAIFVTNKGNITF